MAAVTGTLEKNISSPGGGYSIVVITATLESASDTITLTAATHGISEITSILGAVITSGQGATFTALSVSFSGLVLTVTSVEEDGTASTTWGDVSISLIGKIA